MREHQCQKVFFFYLSPLNTKKISRKMGGIVHTLVRCTRCQHKDGTKLHFLGSICRLNQLSFEVMQLLHWSMNLFLRATFFPSRISCNLHQLEQSFNILSRIYHLPNGRHLARIWVPVNMWMPLGLQVWSNLSLPICSRPLELQNGED